MVYGHFSIVFAPFQTFELVELILTKGWPSVTILSWNLAHCHYSIWVLLEVCDTFFGLVSLRDSNLNGGGAVEARPDYTREKKREGEKAS